MHSVEDETSPFGMKEIKRRQPYTAPARLSLSLSLLSYGCRTSPPGPAFRMMASPLISRLTETSIPSAVIFIVVALVFWRTIYLDYRRTEADL